MATEITSLLLVRHGQSTWNAEHRWQGQANPSLSDHGREQARAAADSIGAVDVIVSSPQDRALETASIIGAQIGVGPVQVLDDLRERNAGEWSGMTTTEIEGSFPGWIEQGRRPEGWEPDGTVLERALRAIEAIEEEFAGATVLVISHGGVILTVEDHLQVRDGRVPNLHGRVLQVGTGGLRPGERLELIPPELWTGGSRHNQV
jgi:broad specificity phosphatase PhoE